MGKLQGVCGGRTIGAKPSSTYLSRSRRSLDSGRDCVPIKGTTGDIVRRSESGFCPYGDGCGRTLVFEFGDANLETKAEIGRRSGEPLPLVELLIVIAIVGVLASLLLRRSSRLAKRRGERNVRAISARSGRLVELRVDASSPRPDADAAPSRYKSALGRRDRDER